MTTENKAPTTTLFIDRKLGRTEQDIDDERERKDKGRERVARTGGEPVSRVDAETLAVHTR